MVGECTVCTVVYIPFSVRVHPSKWILGSKCGVSSSLSVSVTWLFYMLLAVQQLNILAGLPAKSFFFSQPLVTAPCTTM